MTELEQEIFWTQSDISDDEALEGTRDFSDFHRQRLAENRVKLAELEEQLESVHGR